MNQRQRLIPKAGKNAPVFTSSSVRMLLPGVYLTGLIAVTKRLKGKKSTKYWRFFTIWLPMSVLARGS